MEPQMQHLNAPQENLQTWNRVVKMMTTLCIFVALLLAVLAATLVR
jgi:hypothetical protein